MFQGRKNNRISRILLSAVVAMFLTGVGLVLVPGAGAHKSGGQDNGGGNNCTNQGTGIGTNSDKAKGAGEDKNCGTGTGGGGNGSNDGDNDGTDNGGGNDCTNEGTGHGDAAVQTADDEQCTDNDGNGGEDTDGDADDGGATGPTGSTGNGNNGNNSGNGSNGASGVTTSAPNGVLQVKSTSSSSKRKSLSCTSKRRFVIRIRFPHGEHLVSAAVNVNGKRVKTMTGKRIKSTITLIGLPKGTVRVRIRAITNTGRVLHGVRTYHTCVPRRGHTIPKL